MIIKLLDDITHHPKVNLMHGTVCQTIHELSTKERFNLKAQKAYCLTYEYRLDIVWYKKECWFYDQEVRDDFSNLLVENSSFRELIILNKI